MTWIPLTAALLAAITYVSPDSAIETEKVEQSNHKPSLEAWMPLEKQNILGLSKLTEGEKAGLSIWLSRMYDHKMREEGATPFFIQKNEDEGKLLHFNDGSIWAIHPADQERVRWWPHEDGIKIITGENDKYPIQLVLTANGERANAVLHSKPLPAGDGTLAQGFQNRDHWIEGIATQGAAVKLEDGSVWLVHTEDQKIATEWLMGDNLQVFQRDDIEHPFSLMNTSTKQTIRVIKKQ